VPPVRCGTPFRACRLIGRVTLPVGLWRWPACAPGAFARHVPGTALQSVRYYYAFVKQWLMGRERGRAQVGTCRALRQACVKISGSRQSCYPARAHDSWPAPVRLPPATAWVEGTQLNAPPFPATALAEGASLTGALPCRAALGLPFSSALQSQSTDMSPASACGASLTQRMLPLGCRVPSASA